jgi:hypothetical protein
MHLKHQNISVLLVIPSVLSIIGTVLILFTYYKFPRLRTYRHVELAVYVALNDLWAAIELSLGQLQSDSPACWFQGMGSSYNFLSSVMWNSVITYQIYLIVHRGVIIENMTKFHIICWGFPLFPVMLPLITNNYGANANTWCFLVNRPDSPKNSMFVWEIMSFFFFLWLSVIFNTVVFSLIIYRLKEMECAESLSAYKPLYRLAFCPFILVLCWSLPSFLIIYDAVTESNYDGPGAIALDSLSTFLPPFQGFLMAVAFFTVNESARHEWIQYLRCSKPRSTRSGNSTGNRLATDDPYAGASQVTVSRMHTASSFFAGEMSRGNSIFTSRSTTTTSGRTSTTHGSEDHWISSGSRSSTTSKPSRSDNVSDDISIVNRQINMLNDNSSF